jgi:hypothetical protein
MLHGRVVEYVVTFAAFDAVDAVDALAVVVVVEVEADLFDAVLECVGEDVEELLT